MDEKGQISARFEEFGKQLCGDKHGWKKAFADRLGVSPTHVNAILTGTAGVGNTMHARLRELGADVDYIMTGRRKTEAEDDAIIRFHSPNGPPSVELKSRAQRIVQMLMDHPNADSALIERLTKEILSSGK